MSDTRVEPRRVGGNPAAIFRLENIVLGSAAVIGLACGALTALHARDLRDGGNMLAGGELFVLAFFLLGVGVALLIRVISQAGVRLTVDRPLPLAPFARLPAGGSAAELIDALRGGIAPVAIARDPLDETLARLWQGERAPIQVQWLAQAYFRNVAAIMGIGLGYYITVFWIRDTQAGRAVAALFLALLLGCAFRARAQRTELRFIFGVVVLAVLLSLGADFLPSGVLRDMPLPTTGAPVGLMLLIFAAVATLFLFAILAQGQATMTSVADGHARRFRASSQPDAIFEELGRELGKLGIDFKTAPARTYVWDKPQVSGGGHGSFTGRMLAESAPELQLEALPGGVADLIERFRWQSVLTLLAGLCWVAFFITTYRLSGNLVDPAGGRAGFIWVLVLVSIAYFAQTSAHLLWSRLDFVSWIALVEVSGHYQPTRMAIRAGEAGGVDTETESLTINNLDVELWVTRASSLAFGVNGTRRVTGFAGDRAKATAVLNGLAAFLGDQPSIIAPQNKSDFDAAARLGQINRALRGDGGTDGTSKLPLAETPRLGETEQRRPSDGSPPGPT